MMWNGMERMNEYCTPTKPWSSQEWLRERLSSKSRYKEIFKDTELTENMQMSTDSGL